MCTGCGCLPEEPGDNIDLAYADISGPNNREGDSFPRPVIVDVARIISDPEDSQGAEMNDFTVVGDTLYVFLFGRWEQATD